MNLGTQVFVICAFLMLLQDRLSALPAVSEDYTHMAAGVHAGKRLNEIIKPEDVASIGLIENRGKGSPIADGFRPQWDSNGLVRSAFESTQRATDLALSASESSYAKYALITKKGDLYLLDVVCSWDAGNAPTALLLHGRGFGCRIDLQNRNSTKQDGGAQPTTRRQTK